MSWNKLFKNFETSSNNQTDNFRTKTKLRLLSKNKINKKKNKYTLELIDIYINSKNDIYINIHI